MTRVLTSLPVSSIVLVGSYEAIATTEHCTRRGELRRVFNVNELESKGASRSSSGWECLGAAILNIERPNSTKITRLRIVCAVASPVRERGTWLAYAGADLRLCTNDERLANGTPVACARVQLRHARSATLLCRTASETSRRVAMMGLANDIARTHATGLRCVPAGAIIREISVRS